MTTTAFAGFGWLCVVGLALGARRASGATRLPTRGQVPRWWPGSRRWVKRPATTSRWAWPKHYRWPRLARTGDELAAMLDHLARSMRSGFSLRQALVSAETGEWLAGPTARLRSELELGQPIGLAIKRWIELIDDPLAELAGSALVVVVNAGGSGADAIDRVAATLRDRRALELETKALASQAKASALVIALLPVGFLMLASTADPTTLDFLLGTPTGIFCLVSGVLLDGVGLWWMNRITEAIRW